jgi:hypothetical protein
MRLELGKTSCRILDEILVLNILSGRRLPSLVHPSWEPCGQTIDAIFRIRVNHEIAINFTPILKRLHS